MKSIYIAVNPFTKRVEGISETIENGPITTNPEDSFIVEVEEDHDILARPFHYVFVDGQITLDEEYRQQQIEEEEVSNYTPTSEQEIADLWYAIMTGSVSNA